MNIPETQVLVHSGFQFCIATLIGTLTDAVFPSYNTRREGKEVICNGTWLLLEVLLQVAISTVIAYKVSNSAQLLPDPSGGMSFMFFVYGTQRNMLRKVGHLSDSLIAAFRKSV
jgi:hypothetical protein